MKVKAPKILRDTLTNPQNGKYSRKSVTWFIGLWLLVWLVMAGSLTKEYAPEHVFWAVLSLVLGLVGASVYDKLKNQSNSDHE